MFICYNNSQTFSFRILLLRGQDIIIIIIVGAAAVVVIMIILTIRHCKINAA